MSEDGDEPTVFYRERSEWADVKPVPEDDGPAQVVRIAHSVKFQDVYDYFRAVLKSNEKSLRALDLTKDAVELNAANYTVWQYRREILKALKVDLAAELEYVEAAIENSPKNYQVWHHRRVIVEWMRDASRELEFTASVLAQDAKNYHAWQHRQWVVKTFDIFGSELEFIDSLLSDDVRNNSAWNQRYFVVNNHLGWSDFIVQKEICYAIEKIKFVKNNESAWNYLRGILLHDKRGLGGNAVVSLFCEELYKNKCKSVYLLAFIIDICEEKIKKGESSSLYNANRALDLLKLLIEKYDKIRCKYWTYIAEKFLRIKEEEDRKNAERSSTESDSLID